MGSFKPIDESKEEFRQYLARHGVLDAMSQALKKMLQDRPRDPLQYLQTHLAPNIVQKLELDNALRKIDRLQKENEELKKLLQRRK